MVSPCRNGHDAAPVDMEKLLQRCHLRCPAIRYSGPRERKKPHRIHKEEVHDLCFSKIRVPKSSEMGWAGHVARMEKKRNGY